VKCDYDHHSMRCQTCGHKARRLPAFRTCAGVHRPPPGCRAGKQLKRLLAAIGINETPGCSCASRAQVMDGNGCDWCEANIDTIVGWLREEAAKRKLPFVDMAGRLLVKRAIRNARRAAS
jgi:hypothetical protein